MSYYCVRTEVFEGPFDLLLSLIEKRKLFISDISLAQVTDDYLRHLEKKENNRTLGETAHFVLIGSTLLLIKSRSLLPSLSLTPTEQDSIDDLEKRLHILEIYRMAGNALSKKYGKNLISPKKKRKEKGTHFYPGKNLTKENIFSLAQNVIDSFPLSVPKIPSTTVKKVLSLENMMNKLTERINANMEISLKEFAGGNGGKVQLIVSFLAMLELVRKGIVRVQQASEDEDIHISRESLDIPHYG
jgi:segregation and condensation protein A